MTAPLESVRSAVFLAIDQAKSSGWAIRASGQVECGVATSAHQRWAVAERATSFARGAQAPLLVVLEDHRSFAFSRGNTSVRTLLGLGAARGWWEQALEVRGVHPRDMHLVEPRVWRRAVLGLGNVKADQAKAAAVLHARAVTGVVWPDDAAEALCMALWAERNVQPAPVRKLRGLKKVGQR